jgi:hypothetical protein
MKKKKTLIVLNSINPMFVTVIIIMTIIVIVRMITIIVIIITIILFGEKNTKKKLKVRLDKTN